MSNKNIQYQAFLVLLILVTIAFGCLLKPYYGAMFWGATLAIIFMPLNRRLLGRMHGRPNLAALSTVSICILIVIIPVIFITGSLVQEGAVFYQKLSSDQIHLALYFQPLLKALPQS